MREGARLVGIADPVDGLENGWDEVLFLSHFAGWRPLRGHGRLAGSRLVFFQPIDFKRDGVGTRNHFAAEHEDEPVRR